MVEELQWFGALLSEAGVEVNINDINEFNKKEDKPGMLTVMSNTSEPKGRAEGNKKRKCTHKAAAKV